MQDTDYIIVGAGSAGCALASRLTENGRHRVTVLEAGGSDRRFFVQMPLGYGKLFYNPAVNWMYSAEPDPGLNHQRDHIPRGRILGGSSSINAMVWIRGHRADYDEWGAENPGWGWDEVLAAYRQIEDNEAGGNDWRGTGGPLFISRNRKGLHWLVEDYIAACAEAGAALQRRFQRRRTGRRRHLPDDDQGPPPELGCRAFLRPAMRRKNLTVVTGAQVTRVILEGNRAVAGRTCGRGGPASCGQGPR